MSDRNDGKKVARGSTLYTGNTDKLKRERKERLEKANETLKWKVLRPDVKPLLLKKIPDEENIDLILNFLIKNGVRVKDYKRNYIVRRLRARISRNNFATYKQYHQLLTKDKKEFDALNQSISINVTRFMRNKDTYEFVKNDVLHHVVKNAKGKINMWSAGSAVGAEAYSMSIIMSEFTSNYSIAATDIKQELLDLAKGALYDAGYLAEVSSADRQKHFDFIDSRTVKVKSEISSKVHFYKLDLLKDSYPKNMDIIFCRNVLIYIDREPQLQIIKGFLNALKPGGFLVLGRTESIFSLKKLEGLKSYSGKHRVYRKDISAISSEIKNNIT